MKSVFITEYGGPEVVQFSSSSTIPKITPEKILVKVFAAGINFMDIHTRQGKYVNSRTYDVELPCTLGMEGAGEVVEVGKGVSQVKPGDRVAWCIAWGSYAEYATVPASQVVKIPDTISYEQAAASLFQGCTAHYLVNDVSNLTPGSSCLIHAGSGNIGRLLIQLAKTRGARVLATASTQEKIAVAKRYGADDAFLYQHGNFHQEVLAATEGLGVDTVFDSLGLQTLRSSFLSTRKKGLIINYGNVSGSVKNLDPLELGEHGSLFLTRPRLADYMDSQKTIQRRADDIFNLLADNKLKIEIVAKYRLENVVKAHELIENRTLIGKAVVAI
ncbi:quinone oxidoreductase family protein [Salinicola halimionae]|uniref:quinone oxidoreductase family protein n=1 Tax=Salinicola halimionae TaxID=1949081 RepID=UPI000DA1E4B5|nr:quinone oxidoreductase [Salinicola halimionae]